MKLHYENALDFVCLDASFSLSFSPSLFPPLFEFWLGLLVYVVSGLVG